MGPSDASSTLTSSKSSFVTSQIRLLSQPLLAPSVNTLPDAATEKLISAINKKITSHNRLHFGLESQRHVVEQIDGIYWRDVLAGGLPVRKAETTVKRDVDFTESGKAIPKQWEDVVLDERPRKRKRKRTEDRQREHHDSVTEAEAEKSMQGSYEDTERASQEEESQAEPQARAYTALREKLHSQTERRDELRRKLGQYKKLRALLTPFDKPQESIQPNLVTRDNKELEAELAKMRVLLARVGKGIQAQQHQTQAQHHDAIRENVMTDAKKLEAVLGLG
ncbi:hypothetical protein LTR70_010443 [Exophiala xenobiotica]|uniref:Uncharacterized protein n=1 Tax=Lithohypha guttulata TaxID=1690604 RepID=A0ABR0JU12_9EURO|nr:hypothetical protein LTR24_010434 [Lithohypha guttulata]KAK5309266.1 hypothetical protein LTR70_010443 [Exophiala xenobiotica]